MQFWVLQYSLFTVIEWNIMLICKNIAEAFQKCLRAIFLPFPWIPQDDFTYLVCLDQFHLACIAALVHVENILFCTDLKILVRYVSLTKELFTWL